MGRGCREHVHDGPSGTEEEYSEREHLLQDSVDLIDQSHSRKRMLKEEKLAKVEKRESDELEEARFALDKAEREARLELDKRDSENQWKLFQGTLGVLRSFVPKQ
ncbi:hypothetical protein H310_03921 [Aphanomyces invadans]|uniref:Uncharacterized protein n=1 Tax=Aphanomyces invadans TaxID=157072 RepID=A0A024UFX3_9STRA|nr:hypothetical protein H310_03921 [Aphanomyces invadans]ETW04782.1 hypothetical protein H310_03921 [Aphanomyces invadans]|eukprot:XP_008866220.1 hypothetical protein H310_03921 [Aphanomyces invadans]